MESRMDGWRDGWRDGRMDRRMDGQTEPLKTIYPFGTLYARGIIMPIILISLSIIKAK